jgi:Paraquat-inducible protein A
LAGGGSRLFRRHRRSRYPSGGRLVRFGRMLPRPALARIGQGVQRSGLAGILEPRACLRDSHPGGCREARHVGQGRVAARGDLGGGAFLVFSADCANIRPPTGRIAPGGTAVTKADCLRLQQSKALVVTGLILYVPANVLPVTTMTVAGDVQPLTV